MTDQMPDAPECARMVVVAPFSQHIGDFLDWLEDEKEVILALDYGGYDGYAPAYHNKNELLAEFYGIDLIKVEAERRAILDHIREENK